MIITKMAFLSLSYWFLFLFLIVTKGVMVPELYISIHLKILRWTVSSMVFIVCLSHPSYSSIEGLTPSSSESASIYKLNFKAIRIIFEPGRQIMVPY